ncbi:Cytochrome P450 [Cordyceps militaris CM01]|uniref:Cytochrome P450 n=1 Tax=Cordyceps militaris (strain CM01) TaxID=983644 RepID=G3JCC7_CORMM|nr:Cytochrome P450 [Cordyceps militaris CM01]EGX93792.1 Cytochrome P450 [Cordyceps militaris CM01]
MLKLLLFVVAVVVSFVVYRRWLHPLSHFPGPFMASASGLYQTYWSFRPDMPNNFIKLHEKYGRFTKNYKKFRRPSSHRTDSTTTAAGPIVRYSPNGLIFNDHELLAVAYGRRADKSDFFAANFDSDATFNLQKYEDHVASKKAIATAYSDQNLRLFEPSLDKLLTRWLELLHQGTTQDDSVDLYERAGWLASDAVSLLITGKALGFIESQSDVRNLLHNKDNTFDWQKFLAIQENVSWYVRNTWLGRNLIMARPTDKSGVGVFMKERDCIIASAIDKNGHLNRGALVEGSLLSSLLESHFAGNGMSLKDIGAEILFALLAGSSVTPLNLWTVIFLISKDKSVQEKLSLELKHAERLGTIPSKAHITSNEKAQSLPYLHACIQEALRFAPTVSQLPRLSPRDTGQELHGKYVPPGVSVSTSPWVMGRSKVLYGEDAGIYRPERWLEVSTEKRRYWERHGFHFGYGGRKCAARRFALAQLHKSVAEPTVEERIPQGHFGSSLFPSYPCPDFTTGHNTLAQGSRGASYRRRNAMYRRRNVSEAQYIGGRWRCANDRNLRQPVRLGQVWRRAFSTVLLLSR